MLKKLTLGDYTVGWICPLEVEEIAALEMLDELATGFIRSQRIQSWEHRRA
jgi:hypothetical protein